MRVLAVSAPLLGHVFPMVPLLRELASQGHDVAVATAGDAEIVRNIGLRYHEVIPSFDFGRFARRTVVTHPLIAHAELSGTAGTRGASALFGLVNEAMLPGVRAAVDRHQPDLIIVEPLGISGAIAASASSIPTVLLENTLYDAKRLFHDTARRASRALRRLNLRQLEDPVAIVTQTPDRVRPIPPDAWPMQHVPYSTDSDVPTWLLTRPQQRPRVLVTRSTIAGFGSGKLMRAVLDVATHVDADFILVRPDSHIKLDKLPPNVHATDWLPLPRVLPFADILVHHGGAGSTLAAMACGIPQLATPGAGDRRHNATLIADSGVGISLSESRITAAALTGLLANDSITQTAQHVAADNAKMPPPDAIAERLAAL